MPISQKRNEIFNFFLLVCKNVFNNTLIYSVYYSMFYLKIRQETDRKFKDLMFIPAAEI